jgi:hypothetical protein
MPVARFGFSKPNSIKALLNLKLNLLHANTLRCLVRFLEQNLRIVESPKAITALNAPE